MTWVWLSLVRVAGTGTWGLGCHPLLSCPGPARIGQAATGAM